MMFMPAGLCSIGLWWMRHRERQSFGQLASVLSGWLLGCIAAGVGFVFLVEFSSRILDSDYQAMLVEGSAWPAVSLFGGEWLPGQVTVWAVPTVLMVLGLASILLTNRKWRKACEELS